MAQDRRLRKALRPVTRDAVVVARRVSSIVAAVALSDPRLPPSHRLEALRRDRAGQHSIRINDQWRICFVWTDQGATEIEITDYQ